MRQRSGFGATALVALCAIELVSLATIFLAAARAPLVPDASEPDPVDRPERKRHRRASNSQVASLQRIAQ